LTLLLFLRLALHVTFCAREWKPLQVMALFLSVPCFESSNLLFKLAHSIQQRELVRLSRVLLGGEDLFLEFADIAPEIIAMSTIQIRSLCVWQPQGSDGRGGCRGRLAPLLIAKILHPIIYCLVKIKNLASNSRTIGIFDLVQN
jgi:hypothetical protein